MSRPLFPSRPCLTSVQHALPELPAPHAHLLVLLGRTVASDAVCKARQLLATPACCRFQWVDGALTRAVESGQWALLDSANLCNPTVLDRLNPLLEPDGELLLVGV